MVKSVWTAFCEQKGSAEQCFRPAAVNEGGPVMLSGILQHFMHRCLAEVLVFASKMDDVSGSHVKILVMASFLGHLSLCSCV